MIATEEPIVSRLDRLDAILRHLEENRGVTNITRSARSSYASTHSSGNTTDGHDASSDTSPKSFDIHCRSIDEVMTETQLKGTLLDRLDHVEDQVVKLCEHMESELEAEHKRTVDDNAVTPKKGSGLKKLVKSCMIGSKRSKAKNDI